MKFNLILSLIVVFFLVANVFTLSAYADTPAIPTWIKNNAKWWSQGQLGDSDFEKGIQYLIDQKIINIPSQSSTASGAQQIPAWVKNTAGMWASGTITDNDFLRGIEYLVQIGIIQIHTASTVITVSPTSIIPIQPSAGITIQSNASSATATTSVQNATNTSILATSNSTTVISTTANATTAKPSISNTTKSTGANPVVTSASATSNQANVDSLIGTGINLKINGNVASGTLIIAGIRYSAPDLFISEQGSQIQLQGNLQTDDTSTLEAVGVSSNGNEYNFYGTISNSGHSIPVNFAALYTHIVTNQPNTGSTKASITPSQIPMLPMMMLYTQSDHVIMGYPYNLAVKIFDPKTNPQKTFDQFNGGIPDVNIIGTIISNDHVFTSFSGMTDSKGLYQYQLQTAYNQGWQQTFNVMINASKNGYMPQSTTMSFVTLYPNRGSAAPPCSSTISSAPTGLIATSVPPTEVDLSWTASAGATGYNILGNVTDTTFVQIGTSTGTTFDNTGLISGHDHLYEVEATNCAGTSGPSNEASATP